MRLKDKKYAFSLTELLIVLVVLAVLFAALAPILTTRHNGASVSTENIWNYVNDDEQQKDIYYDSGVDKWSSTAYIGLKPSTLSTYSPRSKVVISASKNLRFNNTPQRQIQFRYGAGDGVNAGSLYMDSKNISLGSNNDALIGFVGLTVPDASKNSTENTVAGLGAMSTSTTSNPLPVISGNVAYGTNALKYLTNNRSRNTVVGASALSGSNPVAARDNIFVGSSVANYDRAGGTGNIAVGATSMFSGSSRKTDNVYLGYLVGASHSSARDVSGNVIAGSQYYAGANGTNSQNNTIIGYNALTGGPRNMVNNTAIGYQACNSIQSEATAGSRTCIGYGSGATRGISGTPTPLTIETDSYDHVFLGGMPLGGFNGRSVVEVYNQKSSGIYGGQNPKMSPTVVFNSNLVVRGGFFPARSGNGYLSYFKHDNISRAWLSSRRSADHCGRIVGIGRKKWRWWGEFGSPDARSGSSLEFNGYCLNDRASKTSYEFNSNCPNVKTSDRRLKDIISENNEGLASIEALMPYNFTFKNDKENKAQVGVMAQDLQKVYPSAVVKGKDGYLRIRWDEMFYSMINAIKTLDRKLVAIASSISEMESDVLQIKSEQKNIKKQIAVLNSRAAKLERK